MNAVHSLSEISLKNKVSAEEGKSASSWPHPTA